MREGGRKRQTEEERMGTKEKERERRRRQGGERKGEMRMEEAESKR